MKNSVILKITFKKEFFYNLITIKNIPKRDLIRGIGFSLIFGNLLEFLKIVRPKYHRLERILER